MAEASSYFDTSILVSWEVFSFPAEAPYCAMTTTVWTSQEAFVQAMGTENGLKLQADLPNYSKGAPIIMAREFVGSSVAY